jgi:hypothetical protein
MRATKDGRSWQIGTQRDVAWIRDATRVGFDLTVPIPPIPPTFQAYATYEFDNEPSIVVQERAVVERLVASSKEQAWWLGFLDTGAHDVVFPDVPRVRLYWDWPYVLVKAGPTQALTWRLEHMRSPYGVLPDLFFPEDRSWLVSALWDDDWSCVGGPASLVAVLQQDPRVRARPVLQDGSGRLGWPT